MQRRAAAIVAVACLALGAVAAGGAPASAAPLAPAGAAGSTTSKLLAFTHCMRAHGVPDFPAPQGTKGFPKATLARLMAANPRYRAATRACAHLLPAGAGAPDQSALQRERLEGLRFARCMRRHGVALPDPAGTGRIPDPATVGIDQGSPRFEAANQACGRHRPPYMPSNAEYNAYARAHGS